MSKPISRRDETLVKLMDRVRRQGGRVCAGTSGHGTGEGWYKISSGDATRLVLGGWAHVIAEVTPEHGLRVVVELTTAGALIAFET